MNTRSNIKGMLVIFSALFIVLSVYLVYILNAYGTRWFSSPYNTRLKSQKNNIIAGDILDRTGRKLATTDSAGDRVYISDTSIRKATSHTVGDNYGQTFGAENFFSKYLLGFEQSIFERITNEISGKRSHGSDVELTIDASLCVAAYENMGEHRGAVIIINYKTGEILACVSKPVFDPKYVADYLSGKRELDKSAMVNRATGGRYTPGSVFKLVTALAAIRYLPGITEREFTCSGPLAFDGKTGAYLENVLLTPQEDAEAKKDSEPGMSGEYRVIRDYNGEYHGSLNLKEAFSKSCNHVFAQLALEVGEKRLKRTAQELGLNDDFLFDDLVADSSSMGHAKKASDLAWLGIGQHTSLVTPLNMCMIAGAVANGGVMMEPKLLLSVKNTMGSNIYLLQPEEYKKSMSETEASTLKAFMVEAVKSGTGRSARINGFAVGGKTGTAETSSGEKEPNAWFVGFVEDEEHPLAVCVVLEEGGSGGKHAAPVAREVLKKAFALGY